MSSAIKRAGLASLSSHISNGYYENTSKTNSPNLTNRDSGIANKKYYDDDNQSDGDDELEGYSIG